MTWPTIFDHKLEDYYVMEMPGQQLAAALAKTRFDNLLNLDIHAPPACVKRTTIMASMGASTFDVEIMEKMMAAGMNIACLNMSFGTREQHIETIKMLREAADKFSASMGKTYPLAIALRLTGRKIRTGKIVDSSGDHIVLITGESVRLTTEDTYKDRCSTSTIFVDFVDFAEQLKKGDIILIDNESIELKVEIISSTTLTCKIERGGTLGSYKDVFVPNVVLKMPLYTKSIKLDIEMAIEQKVDFLIASFVSSVANIKELKGILRRRQAKLGIIANIQTVEGFRNYEEILKAVDGIMVTRQELGSDITPKKLPIAQKNLIARANQANVPVCVSCHLLSSMRYSRMATRAELLDIGNCILDGADCLELGPETAVGVDPVLTVSTMTSACREAEACIWSKQAFADFIEKIPSPCDHITGVAMTAALAAQKSMASAIVAITTTGHTAKLISKYSPRCPIVAITRFPSVAKQLHLWRGVVPFLYEDEPNKDWFKDVEIRVIAALKWSLEKGFIRVGDPIIVVYCWKQGSSYTNTMRIMYAPRDIAPEPPDTPKY